MLRCYLLPDQHVGMLFIELSIALIGVLGLVFDLQ